MSTPSAPARTYNQNHVARKHTPGKRRLSIYWSWSYPFEAQRDPADRHLDDRADVVRRLAQAADRDPVGEKIVVSLADIRGMDEKARLGAVDGQGIVESGVDSDWHDTNSSLIVSLAESLNRKAEPVSNLLSLNCIPPEQHAMQLARRGSQWSLGQRQLWQ